MNSPAAFPRAFSSSRHHFTNGQSAARQMVPLQPLAGDYADGYRFTHATGSSSIASRSNDLVDPGVSTNRYRGWRLLLQARDSRVLLLDCRRQYPVGRQRAGHRASRRRLWHLRRLRHVTVHALQPESGPAA